ncbi:MAG: elongation factor Ts, partial [Acidimicrobiia bacterium]
ARPTWLSREDVPEADISKERDLIAAQARNEGKPDEIVDKIVDGRIGSFYKENVLLDQVFVKTDVFEGTVGDMVQQLAAKMGENISVASMARVEIGEN